MQQQNYINKRKYIRLNSCFPVEFSFYISAGTTLSKTYQGFTRDLSEGGLCLEAKNLSQEDAGILSSKKLNMNVVIDIPVIGHLVKATAKIAWVKKLTHDKEKNDYLVGLSYLNIEQKDRRRIVNYARRLKYLPRLTAALIALMFLGLALLSFYHFKTRKENKILVKQLVTISGAKADIEKRLNETKVRKEMLDKQFAESSKSAESLKLKIARTEKRLARQEKKLSRQLEKALFQQKELELKIADIPAGDIESGSMAYKITETRLTNLNKKIELLQMELDEVTKKADAEKAVFEKELSLLQEDNASLKSQIKLARQGEVLLEEQLAQIKLKSGQITRASVDKMLKWLNVHQTKKTGLVLSYEGDNSLKDWGFTYDQALACQAFLIMGETERAKKVLEFFQNKAKRSNGLFYNAYDVKTGLPCECVVHNGPNIWIAIAACHYTYRTRDERFLKLAEDIAFEMMITQGDSDDGSIKGGPDSEWVSTEHNLDAYSLFNMLYKITGDEVYEKSAFITFQWLKQAGYDAQEGRFLRGKGDATIATDTFSWAIAAIGPEKLAENEMNPDGIMEFAEKECRVETKFYRPEGRSVDVVGFDFAKAENLGRGGIISTEWTAQMVSAFKIMADYYRSMADAERESIYNLKAEYYLSQLSKMVVSSPSPTGQGEGCLPYASIDNVRTGHGWRVAKGRRTGSVAATAYYIFAYRNHNPLKLK